MVVINGPHIICFKDLIHCWPSGLDSIHDARCICYIHEHSAHFATVQRYARFLSLLPSKLASHTSHECVSPNELSTDKPKKLVRKLSCGLAGFQSVANICPSSLDRPGPFLI